MSSHSATFTSSILHQVLKMTPFCSYRGSESRTPLIYRFVYDVLSNAVPHTQQALTQLVDVIYAFLVDPLLLYSPDLIIHGVHIWAVWGPLVGRNKVWRKSAIVSRALCTGALSSYWNMKLSPDIFLMHGNSFSFSSTSQ